MILRTVSLTRWRLKSHFQTLHFASNSPHHLPNAKLINVKSDPFYESIPIWNELELEFFAWKYSHQESIVFELYCAQGAGRPFHLPKKFSDTKTCVFWCKTIKPFFAFLAYFCFTKVGICHLFSLVNFFIATFLHALYLVTQMVFFFKKVSGALPQGAKHL